MVTALWAHQERQVGPSLLGEVHQEIFLRLQEIWWVNRLSPEFEELSSDGTRYNFSVKLLKRPVYEDNSRRFHYWDELTLTLFIAVSKAIFCILVLNFSVAKLSINFWNIYEIKGNKLYNP